MLDFSRHTGPRCNRRVALTSGGIYRSDEFAHPSKYLVLPLALDSAKAQIINVEHSPSNASGHFIQNLPKLCS